MRGIETFEAPTSLGRPATFLHSRDGTSCRATTAGSDRPLVAWRTVSRRDLDEERIDAIHVFNGHSRQEPRQGRDRGPADTDRGQPGRVPPGDTIRCLHEEAPVIGQIDVRHTVLGAALEERQRQGLVGACGAYSDLDVGHCGLEGGRLLEIARAGRQPLREFGIEAAESLVRRTAARTDPKVRVSVAKEVLDEKRTEIPARAHDEDAAWVLTAHAMDYFIAPLALGREMEDLPFGGTGPAPALRAPSRPRPAPRLRRRR